MNAPPLSLVSRELDLLAPAPAGRSASDVEHTAGECAAALRVIHCCRPRAAALPAGTHIASH